VCELQLSKCCVFMKCCVTSILTVRLRVTGYRLIRRTVIHSTTKGGAAKLAVISDKIGMNHWMYFNCTNSIAETFPITLSQTQTLKLLWIQPVVPKDWYFDILQYKRPTNGPTSSLSDRVCFVFRRTRVRKSARRPVFFLWRNRLQ
jgi:hypothetical protein